MTPEISQSDVYTHFDRFAELRSLARNQSDQAIREVAQQFESLFLQMMIKSMRDASFGGGLMENDQTRFYRDMHDKQLSLHLAKTSNLGLADLIAGQLGKPEEIPQIKGGQALEGYRIDSIKTPVRPVDGAEKPVTIPAEAASKNSNELKINQDEPIKTPEEFIRRLTPYARQAAAELGVDPKILVAQAALETGWGKAVIRHTNGASSHNLFGIKADNRWQGDRVSVTTLEYHRGVAEKHRANFRSYSGFKESFDDYVQFLKRNGRYQTALGNSGDAYEFIKSLQEAGYATDPKYAEKVIRIFEQDDFADVS